jgi:hypothetical protein
MSTRDDHAIYHTTCALNNNPSLVEQAPELHRRIRHVYYLLPSRDITKGREGQITVREESEIYRGTLGTKRRRLR